MTVWKWQIMDTVSREPEGIPYRYLDRCLMRVLWLNATTGEYRYSLKPVRTRE